MKHFTTVFSFELMNLLQKKSVQVGTIIISVVICIITSIPSLVHLVQSIAPEAADTNKKTGIFSGKIGFVLSKDMDTKRLIHDFNITTTDIYESESLLTKHIEAGDLDGGFVIKSSNHGKQILKNKQLLDLNASIFQETMKSNLTDSIFEQAGIDSSLVQRALDAPITMEEEILGKNAAESFFLAYVFIFVVYMLIVLYGSSVSTSVAREKESRAMELLITSTDPKTLILGKVAAAGLTGMIQLFIVILAGVIGFYLNKAQYPLELIAALAGNLDTASIIVFSVFSLLGYTLYLFIYAALGSLVSKMEDVSSAVMPITLFFMIAFFIAVFALQMPGNFFIKITSYIPFVSMFTMPIRFALMGIPIYELLISGAILILTTVLVARLSIYIYKYGSLNYGNRIQWSEIIKGMK